MAQSPMLCTILTYLNRALMTSIWEVRIAAARAIAKIAVRSSEPFRVQCYNILAAASGAVHKFSWAACNCVSPCMALHVCVHAP